MTPEALRAGPVARLVVVTAALVLAAGVVLLFSRSPAPQAAEPPAAPNQALGETRRASPEEVRAWLNDTFDRLDRDGSGGIERAEAPRRQVISATLPDGSLRQLPLTQAEWFARGDGDGDGRVNRTEYFARLVPPVQAIAGVPQGWQPR